MDRILISFMTMIKVRGLAIGLAVELELFKDGHDRITIVAHWRTIIVISHHYHWTMTISIVNTACMQTRPSCGHSSGNGRNPVANATPDSLALC